MHPAVFKSYRASTIVDAALKTLPLSLFLFAAKDIFPLYGSATIAILSFVWRLFRNFELLFPRELRMDGDAVWLMIGKWKIKIDIDRAALTIRNEIYGARGGASLYAIVLALNKANGMSWFFKNVMLLKYEDKGGDLVADMESWGKTYGIRCIPFYND